MNKIIVQIIGWLFFITPIVIGAYNVLKYPTYKPVIIYWIAGLILIIC